MAKRRGGHARGQVLVLASLVLFVLCLAVLAVVNLGHQVTERVRLLNSADAAAYSVSAMEARAFNFYAFANRTHVSHYVSAMAWQSHLSFIYFTEAFLTDFYGVMKSLDGCAGQRRGFWLAACPVLENVPYLGPALRVLGMVIQVYRGILAAYQRSLRVLDPDSTIGRQIIPAHRQLNQALTVVSDAVMVTALKEAQEAAKSVAQENDKDVDVAYSQAVSGALNACLFDRAHSRESNGSPLAPADPFQPIQPSAVHESSKESRAKRVMGALSNATRFACDADRGPCTRGFVTARKLGDGLPLPAALAPIRKLMEAVPHWGQTRLLSYELAKGFDDREDGNLIRHWKDPPNAPQAMMAQGDNLGADDLYFIKLGPASLGPFHNPFACNSGTHYSQCWGDPRQGAGDDRTLPFRAMLKTSVWAMNASERNGRAGGVHWRVSYVGWPPGRGQVDPKGPEARLGLHRSSVCVTPAGCVGGFGVSVDVYVANVRPIEDGNHLWEGIVPFMHFEPGDFAEACPSLRSPSPFTAATRSREFNQPSAWVLLNKSPRALRNASEPTVGTNAPALLNEQGSVSFELGGRSTLQLDGSPAGAGRLPPGLNAIARAQTYYHRPGNWAEQPNFFNPYWRPRLASVFQGRETSPLVAELLRVLPPAAARQPEKFVTH